MHKAHCPGGVSVSLGPRISCVLHGVPLQKRFSGHAAAQTALFLRWGLLGCVQWSCLTVLEHQLVTQGDRACSVVALRQARHAFPRNLHHT